MSNIPVLAAVKKLGRPFFTTHELGLCGTGSSSNTVQALGHLVRQGVVMKVARGVWALEADKNKISPYALASLLSPRHRVYVSFTSALHLHGMIEQIPQTVTLASTGHTRTIRTRMGTYCIHRISPVFFKGFDWYRGEGSFLIAAPEKALVDCLYLSSRRKKQFGHFPELHLSASFSFKKAREWVGQIRDARVRAVVLKRWESLKKGFTPARGKGEARARRGLGPRRSPNGNPLK